MSARPWRVSWDVGDARVPQRRSGAIIRLVQVPLRPVLRAMARHRWIDADRLPQQGGAVLCGNHLGPFDAFAFGYLMQAQGIAPRFLAKESLFRLPLLGALIRGSGQIPVLRGTARSADALTAAQAALEDGSALMVFPEGTYSRDPRRWPMRGRLGAARLSLQTGAPMYPIACWGSHQVWPQGALLPRLWPRRTITMRVGEPIHLEQAEGETELQAVVRGTEEVLDAITALLATTRGEEPPVQRYDPRKDAHRPEEGRPARTGLAVLLGSRWKGNR